MTAHHTPLSRLLAVTLLFGFLVMVYLLLLPLQHRYSTNQQELEGLVQQLTDYERIAKSRSQIEGLFQSIHSDDEASGHYLKGATRALASAELQAYARSVIEASKGNLVSTRPMVRAEREPDRLVKVNVHMSGTIESMVQVFYRNANGAPAVLVDEVLIRRKQSTVARSEREDRDGTLDIQFTLTGFVKESVS